MGKIQKSKEEKARAAMAGGKGKKKKVNNFVLFDQPTYDKLMAEVPKYKMITTSILADRLRLNGSLARKAIKLLLSEGKIKPLCEHARQSIYTRATAQA